jgi:excisionase family DNA binding protein
MNTDKTKFIKPRDIAKLLKLNIVTIYEYIREGKLRAVKLGRNYRIEEKDLEEFIQQNVVKTIKN